MNPSIGNELHNRYRVELSKRIGRDAFAEVYHASIGGAGCAVKISNKPIDDSQDWVADALAELEQAKRFNDHPHVAAVLDVWQIAGHLVVREELADKRLVDRFRECKAKGESGIPRDELLVYVYETAQAIDFLNQKDVYHRDVRPENLLLVAGNVKLAGLGLARFVDQATGCLSEAAKRGYNPPETDVDQVPATIDLYALAASYIRLRTGQEPFGTNPTDVADRKRVGRPVFYGLEAGEFSAVCRALAFRAEGRPHDGAVAWVKTLGKLPDLGATPLPPLAESAVEQSPLGSPVPQEALPESPDVAGEPTPAYQAERETEPTEAPVELGSEYSASESDSTRYAELVGVKPRTDSPQRGPYYDSLSRPTPADDESLAQLEPVASPPEPPPLPPSQEYPIRPGQPVRAPSRPPYQQYAGRQYNYGYTRRSRPSKGPNLEGCGTVLLALFSMGLLSLIVSVWVLW